MQQTRDKKEKEYLFRKITITLTDESYVSLPHACNVIISVSSCTSAAFSLVLYTNKHVVTVEEPK